MKPMNRAENIRGARPFGCMPGYIEIHMEVTAKQLYIAIRACGRPLSLELSLAYAHDDDNLRCRQPQIRGYPRLIRLDH